ncbi:MAG: PHB depolymerase family esterase [Cellvibrionaceae bacterium]
MNVSAPNGRKLAACAIYVICFFISSCLAQTDTGFNSQAVVAEQRQLDLGETRRSYLLHIPVTIAQAETEQSWPLVILLHGGGGNGQQISEVAGLTDVAMRENFIVAYPNGSGRFRSQLTWNAETCCAYAMTEGVDDIGYINQLLDDALSNFPVDGNRIYLAGLSNGGMMTYRLASALNHRLAGVAIVSGALFADQAQPDAPIPVLIVHGREDEILPWEGGKSDRRRITASMNQPFLAVDEAFSFWLKANGCDATAQREPKDQYTVFKGQNCNDRGTVQLVELFAGAHAWPGGKANLSTRLRGENPEQLVSASEMVWRFFEDKQR